VAFTQVSLAGAELATLSLAYRSGAVPPLGRCLGGRRYIAVLSHMLIAGVLPVAQLRSMLSRSRENAPSYSR